MSIARTTAGDIRGSAPRQPRRGFSLVELMIAIMILGLGMVMVATVFPISLDMTRETLQMSISQSAADTAYGTLALRMPTDKFGLDGNSAPPAEQRPVLFPNSLPPWSVDPLSPFSLRYMTGVEHDNAITLAEAALYPDNPRGYGIPSGVAYEIPAPIRPYVRAYTERGYMDAEFSAAADHYPFSYAIDAMTLRAQWKGNPLGPFADVDPPFPQFFLSGLGRQTPPRIHVVDRMYPPVPVIYDHLNDGFLDPLTRKQVTYQQVAEVISGRRYSWMAFARENRQTSPELQGVQTFSCTIAVTHRADLNARYARQEWQKIPEGFYFTEPDGRPNSSSSPSTLELLQDPQADAAAADALFPQPWLITLDRVDTGTGMITFYEPNGKAFALRGSNPTPSLDDPRARMLPTGAYFIVAQTPAVLGDRPGLYQAESRGLGGFAAGVPFKIVHSAPEKGVVQIAKGMATVLTDVVVWVFPPPVGSRQATGRNTPAGQIEFARGSPVIGAVVRDIALD